MRLVELELVALLAAIDLEAPASVLVVLASARRLDDAVQRDELGYDDPSHLAPPSGRFHLRPPVRAKLIYDPFAAADAAV